MWETRAAAPATPVSVCMCERLPATSWRQVAMWWRRAVLPSLPCGFCFLSFFLGTGLARALALFVCDCVDFGFLFSFSRLVRSRQDTLQTSHTFTQSNHMPPRRRDCLRVAGGQSNATAAELLFGALVRGSSDRSEPAAGDRAASDRRQNPQRLPLSVFFLSVPCPVSCEGVLL